MTRVGLWFTVLWVMVVVAAVNTGNNGLFLVLAVMGAAIVVSHVLGRCNVRGVEAALDANAEIFANSPVSLEVEIRNRGRWLPRWQLILALDPRDAEPAARYPRDIHTSAVFVPHLATKGQAVQRMEILMRRRGRYRFARARLSSLFPLGFFRKGVRLPTAVELLVYPEVFSPSTARPAQTGKSGAEPTRRAGWGHDLFALRSFRYGDDPRAIHWKQSARTGALILNQRESEENRRLQIVFDNAVGELSDAADMRFERLVSEAATAALGYLAGGYEVALLTRDTSIGFGGGRRQRRAILEALARIEALPEASRPLAVPRPDVPHMLLAMDRHGRDVRMEQVA
jgi:uncharacterized protein (DUF58 family)